MGVGQGVAEKTQEMAHLVVRSCGGRTHSTDCAVSLVRSLEQSKHTRNTEGDCSMEDEQRDS